MNLSDKIITFIVCVCISMWGTCFAMSRDFNDSLNSPDVPSKASAAVARHMQSIGKKFEQHGFSVKTVRNNEVVLITLPAENLFAPNSTTLFSEASALLAQFERAIAHPEAYRMIVAVYTDDTGDDEYSLSLTKKRAEAVQKEFDRIAARLNAHPNISYYWFGNREDKFLVPNNSVVNRSKNRRVEIYLIPEIKTIESARSGRL